MLEANGKSAEGSHVIVFTDGGENQYPYINDVKYGIMSKKLTVHALLLDGVADDHDLIKLAVETGGDFCIYEDSGSGGIDYYQCMINIINKLGSFASLEVIHLHHLILMFNSVAQN